MKHIEFIGVPGSGKTTICRELSLISGFYGGVMTDGLARIGTNTLRILSNILPLNSQIVMWEKLLSRRYYRDFIAEHPQFQKMIPPIISEVHESKDHVRWLFKRSAGQYQFLEETHKCGEIGVFDEGFLMRAVSAVYRGSSLPFDQYFESIPVPDMVIYVSVPDDTAEKRQKDRKGHQSFDKIEELRKCCESIVDLCESNSIPVEEVKNTDTVDSTRDEVVSQIKILNE